MVETLAGRVRKRGRHQDKETRVSKPPRERKHAHNGKSHLDAMPREVLENIVRYTSERPCSSNWSAYVAPKVALQLLKPKSVFLQCARGLFRAINCSEHKDCKRSGICVVDAGGSSYTEFPGLFSALRDTVTEIGVFCESLPTTWKRSLTVKCPSLKRLSLYMWSAGDDLELTEILVAQAGHLDTLEVGRSWLRKQDVKAIADLGKGLRALHLSVHESDVAMGPMWKSVGDTLEELSIEGSEHGDYGVPAMRRHCKNLRKLSFFMFPPAQLPHLETLCVQLGKQLTSLTLETCFVEPAVLEHIATACSNVAIELSEGLGCTLDALIAMGENAHRVDVGPLTFVVPEDEAFGESGNETLRRVSERCGKLVGIGVFGEVPQAPFRTLFLHPKPLLVDFRARFELAFDAKFVFEVLTQRLSSLQTFEFEGNLPETSVFRDLVNSNPSLKKVKLVGRSRNWRCICAVGAEELVRMFLKCRMLEEFSLSCFGIHHCVSMSEDYATTCLPARFKNIAVTMCGYQYS